MNSAPVEAQREESAQPTPVRRERLVSLDALRGFDMFWIMGGALIIVAAADITSWGWLDELAEQTKHPRWHGFHLIDLVFPLFLFIAGVATPFSIENRLARGDSRAKIYRHIVMRGLILVFLGMVYNGLLQMDWSQRSSWEEFRFPQVLGRIGLAYMFGALIAMNTGLRGRILWIAVLLIGYWNALRYIPVPGFGAYDLVEGHTLTDYIDRLLIPGRLAHHDPHNAFSRDPEGIFATIPAIATALFGVITGQLLKRQDWNGYLKTLAMTLLGIACLGLAWLWNKDFPFNKNLWSSSFVLHCAGLSLLLLSLFYLVVDVWKFRRSVFFFVVIGANSILTYMAIRFVDYRAITSNVFGGLLETTGKLEPVLLPAAAILVQWLVLLYCYRNRIFLRV